MSASLPVIGRNIQGNNTLYFEVRGVAFVDAQMHIGFGMHDGLTSAGTYMTTTQARALAAALIEVADFRDAAAAEMKRPLSSAPAEHDTCPPLTGAAGAVLCDETGPAHPMPVSQIDGD